MTNSLSYQAVREAVSETLSQGARLLESLTNEEYNQNVPSAFNATIGGHYRHCIEHFEALLLARERGEVNYDARERDTFLETDRDHALTRTRALIGKLAESSDDTSFQKVYLVRCKVSYQGDASPAVPSTLARESMYVVVHAIHHFALISVMCRILDIPIPDGFGVAPSTIHHQEKQTAQRPTPHLVAAS